MVTSTGIVSPEPWFSHVVVLVTATDYHQPGGVRWQT